VFDAGGRLKQARCLLAAQHSRQTPSESASLYSFARPLAALIATAVSPMMVSLSRLWRDTINDTIKLIGSTRISPNPYGYDNIKKSWKTAGFRTSPEGALVTLRESRMGRKILILNRIYFLNQGYTTRYTLMSNGSGRIRVEIYKPPDSIFWTSCGVRILAKSQSD
jgi:hypothetical protein